MEDVLVANLTPQRGVKTPAIHQAIIMTVKPSFPMYRKLLFAGVFALTMGYFEAAVVEYLRQLIYPDGFSFPLRVIPTRLLLVELGREAASLTMLGAVALFIGKTFIDRFTAYCYCFGVWDISYYIFLKLIANWPSSPGTVDLLFLIPAPWIGPVWAPVGISLGLIWAAVRIWKRIDEGVGVHPTSRQWILAAVIGVVLIGSFLYGAPAAIKGRVPPAYPWYIWVISMATGLILCHQVTKRKHRIG